MARPSIVVISAPSACTASIVQHFTDWPSTSNVHDPHSWRVAADVRAGEAEHVSYVVHEEQAVFDVVLVRGAIDRDLDPQDGPPPYVCPTSEPDGFVRRWCTLWSGAASSCTITACRGNRVHG